MFLQFERCFYILSNKLTSINVHWTQSIKNKKKSKFTFTWKSPEDTFQDFNRISKKKTHTHTSYIYWGTGNSKI